MSKQENSLVINLMAAPEKLHSG